MSRDITSILFPSCEKYTDEMYLGNEPAGRGHDYMIDGDINNLVPSDRWECKYGNAETLNDEICNSNLHNNPYDNVYIIGDTLWVTAIRNFKNHCVTYSFCNNDKMSSQLDLELEKAIKIIDKLPDCKLSRMTKNKAYLILEDWYWANKDNITIPYTVKEKILSYKPLDI